MRFKPLALVSVLAMLVNIWPAYGYAENTEIIPSAVIITEVYPNAPGPNETGQEYIELHNTTTSQIDLTGFELSRTGTTTRHVLDGLVLEAGEYKAIFPTFALLNGGGTVYLDYPPDELGESFSIEVVYQGQDESHSWTLVGDKWQNETPTPNSANPEIIEEEPPIKEPILCDISTIFINEIMANPAGADTLGGEFVEIYNEGVEAVSLEGCVLSTDKLVSYELPKTMLEPGQYYVIELADKLLNATGKVTFITFTGEEIIEYPQLGDDEAWAIIDGKWELTKQSTPGQVNKPTPIQPPAEEPQLQPCPAGKYRNPATNRCRNIVNLATSLLPCGPGQTRNPVTNRCRKLQTVGSALKPCQAGQVRNPETNRCRKVAGATTTRQACQPGYERNEQTNRCRKVAVPLAANIAFPESGPAELHNGTLILITLLALLYGVYEYRLDLNNWYVRLRTKSAKS